MKRVVAVCAVAVLVALAGCGSTTRSGAADPAGVAPATSLAYASFAIAPQGSEKAAFDTAFGKLLGPSPEARLGQAFTRAAQTSGTLDYETDVKPWLGGTISAFVTHIGRDRADYGVLIASTDDGKAQAAIDKDLAGSGAESRSYRDVSYKVLSDGTANGVVAHFVVAGTEAAFKAVVDAVKDGTTLATSAAWKSSVGTRGDGKAGLAYVDLKAVLGSLASDLPGAQSFAGPFLVRLLQLHPVVATLDARPDSLVVDVSSPGTNPDPRGPGAASSKLIESLPADSWLALALPKVGQALDKVVQALKANPLIAPAYQRAATQLRAATGIDLDHETPATVGDVAVFARGTTAQTVGGALVVRSRRPAHMAATVRRLPALIRARTHGHVRVTDRSAGFDVTSRRARQPLQVRVGASGAVAAYGAAALREALQPSTQLGTTPLFQKAATAIGGRPTLFVALGPALQLAASSPHHKGEGGFQRALPHLEHLEYVALGARRAGDVDILRAVAGLR